MNVDRKKRLCPALSRLHPEDAIIFIPDGVLRAGEDPAAALCGAQLALESVDPSFRNPAAWAGFQLLGGPVPPRPSSGR